MNTTPKKSVIVLAAGQGTRMKSPLPKVLHPVSGQPMIQYIISALKDCAFNDIRVVVGFGENLVRPLLEQQGIVCFRQMQQLGTADAVRAAQPETIEDDVLIVNGDHPLITKAHIEAIMKEFSDSKADLAVVTCVLKEPKSFGRIVRHYENIKAIVEAKDASIDTLKINEINTGIYVAKASVLNLFLPEIGNSNKQNEFYLTDIVSKAVENGKRVIGIKASPAVAFGVNSQEELAKATKLKFKEKCKQLMESGVIIIDPSNTYIEPSVRVGSGCVIYPGAYIKGVSVIGSFTVLEPNVFIVDSVIHDGAQIRAGSYIEKTVIKSKATVGPYARLRPNTLIEEEAHVGNFVEMKNVTFGRRAKAGHLTYLGDAEVGEDSNIGCGTITCNYAVDKKKYQTKIGKNVFVGSDTQFIAPITVGDNAVIGSGSTITKDVPADALAVARGKQFIKENYNKK
ncbi:MAG: bifunctional UDP-N-acetylglucosamine diphosphorylase/glucosamine-1-phosphate N-acetyltransferase GlmU [Bdellovibrionaceae bacterium]|nr:bifunctional UDP-N-acetylglucosamine diphosphorylase/glucosamine-1-phosphate N-acetyltransferase GlmU [Pseudobdellovibrionaceae bacterium]